MSLTSESRLAETLMRDHPDRAAAVLERIPIIDSTRVLSGLHPRGAAAILQRMSPLVARDVLERLSDKRMVRVLEALDVSDCAHLMRPLNDERQQAALTQLPAAKRASLTTLLQFPENSAGALMDPDMLAVAQDLTAREALIQIQKAPRNAHYNLYVVDRQGVLVGALNLRELFLARPKSQLTELMVPNPFRIDAAATRSAVIAHPGWKVVHSLPVADAQGRYVGAIRYSTLRKLEEAFFRRTTSDHDSASALGELFGAGASALLVALTAPGNPSEGDQ